MNADLTAVVLSLGLFFGIPAAVVGMMLLRRRAARRRLAEGDVGYGDDGSGIWTAGAANGLSSGFVSGGPGYQGGGGSC